jgi:hypothetical protein
MFGYFLWNLEMILGNMQEVALAKLPIRIVPTSSFDANETCNVDELARRVVAMAC